MPATPINITDHATPALKSLLAAAKPGPLNQVIGRAGVNVFRKHLFAKNASNPNQLGGRRTNFYSAAAKATSFEVNAIGPLISVNKIGIRQRYEGGTIKPVKGTFLALAADAEAYGKSPREFNNLKFGYAMNKYGHLAPALVEAEATLIKRQKRGYKARTSVGGKPLFWLARQVHQDPDPTVLPTEQVILDAIIPEVVNHLTRANARSN